MPYLRLAAIKSSDSSLKGRFTLDATQPYMADHQAGGIPLFGTSMGIEAMRRTAFQLVPDAVLRSIEAVETGPPFILAPGTAPCLDTQATVIARDDTQVSVACALSSRAALGPSPTHFRCRMVLEHAAEDRKTRSSAEREYLPAWPHGNQEVSSADVYELFFHGPAFRVIGTATWSNNRMHTRLACGLPALYSPDVGLDPTTPQLIEFALQSAGLYEVASSRRMMIPYAIESIAGAINGVISCGRMHAEVTRSSVLPDSLDVVVADEYGLSQLFVRGYQTVPLPFGTDTECLSTLHRRFQ